MLEQEGWGSEERLENGDGRVLEQEGWGSEERLGGVLEQEGWGSEERLEMVECWSKRAGGVRRGWRWWSAGARGLGE